MENKKLTKKISKDRFIYLKDNICILDTMVHENEEYDTVIIDEPILSEDINKLAKAVMEFEKNTGLKIEIH